MTDGDYIDVITAERDEARQQRDYYRRETDLACSQRDAAEARLKRFERVTQTLHPELYALLKESER